MCSRQLVILFWSLGMSLFFGGGDSHGSVSEQGGGSTASWRSGFFGGQYNWHHWPHWEFLKHSQSPPTSWRPIGGRRHTTESRGARGAVHTQKDVNGTRVTAGRGRIHLFPRSVTKTKWLPTLSYWASARMLVAPFLFPSSRSSRGAPGPGWNPHGSSAINVL